MDGLDKNTESGDNEGEVCRKDNKIQVHYEEVVLRNVLALHPSLPLHPKSQFLSVSVALSLPPFMFPKIRL